MFNKNTQQDSKQRFTIKKYSFGVTSALVGLFFLGGASAQAEEVTASPVNSASSPITNSETPSTSTVQTPQPAEVAPLAESVTAVSVEDYKKTTATKQEVTVEGYIAGTLTNGTTYASPATHTNIALASTPTAEAKDTVPVQLPSGAVRTQYNVKDNPANLGKKVRVTGTSDNYFSKLGIRGTSKIEIIEDASITPSPKPTETPVLTPAPTPTPTETPSRNVTPIAQLRNSEQGKEYSLVGKLISPTNAWGGQGFYLQDKSGAGIYVYPRRDLGLKQGDVVELSGKLSKYGSELQVADITASKKVADEINTPTTTLTIPTLAEDKQSTLVKLENVKVGNISSDSYETASFEVTDKDGNVVAVRVDNRSGVKAGVLKEKIGTNDVINLTGILSSFQNNNQIKPFSLDHFEVVEKAPVAPAEVVSVATIQGEGHESQLKGKAVNVKDVVVTYIERNNKFYVQDLVADGNVKTSDGVAVFQPNHTVKVGDKLEILGEVEEFLGNGYADKNQTDLTTTQIKAKEVKVVGTADLPKTIVLGEDRVAPTKVIEDDAFAKFEPENDALDFWESLEGMVVTVKNARVLGPQKYGEIYVLPGSDTSLRNNSGGISLEVDNYNPQKISLLTTNTKFVTKAGDFFGQDVSGPISYSYTNYKLLVDNKALSSLQDGGLKPEVSAIVKDEEKLSIASYNIENFSANKKGTSDEKVTRIAKSFVSDLHSPDIITLVEVQDNNGETNDGTTDASQSAQRLIDEIKAQGGPNYKYVDYAPENNADGGAPGGNIRTGFLYNAERVKLSDKPAASSTEAAVWENGELKHSISRINPTSSVWAGTRKVPVAEFEFKGEKVVVLGLHLNSKRGDMGVFGKVQPPQFNSEPKRHELAREIKNFVEAGFAQNERANIVILGDYNDYEFSETLRIMESAGLKDLVSAHDKKDRYSYFYQGNNQTLDHAMISGHLSDNYEFDMVHVNSAFMEEHGRASDHDPLLLQIDIRNVKEAPTVEAKPEIVIETAKGTGLVAEELPTVVIETKVPEVAPTVEAKPEIVIETAKGTGLVAEELPTVVIETKVPEVAPTVEEKPVLELPVEVVSTSTPQSGVLALTPEKPELDINLLLGTNSEPVTAVPGVAPTVDAKPELDPALLTKTSATSTNVEKLQEKLVEKKVARAEYLRKGTETSSNVLPKTSASQENSSSLPLGLAAALAGAGLLASRRKQK
ncbi:MAG: DUF6359 domain-containing protein [Gemella sp.]|nr:DUF6359 domain-containing protein [Gemella sp.]